MELRLTNARVPASLAMGLLMLLCRPVIADGAGVAPPPLLAQGQREVGPPGAAGNQQLLIEIDQLIHDGWYGKAEIGARDALSAIDAAGEGRSYAAALVSDRLVEALLQGGKGGRPEALARARLAASLKEDLRGPEDVETAHSIERLGRVLTKHSDFPAARQNLDRALGMLEASPGPNGLAAADARRSIGSLLYAQGQYESARPWLEQALIVHENALGPSGPGVAHTLRIIGDCAKQRQDIETAMRLLRRSQQIYEQTLGPHHPDLARTLTSLGQTLRQAGDFDQAKVTLQRAVAILEGFLGSESPLVTDPLDSLALVLTETGDYQAAAADFDRVLAIRLREHGPNAPRVATTLNNFAILRASMGDYLEAARLFGEAARVWETALGPWHPDLAFAVENRGIALGQAGRYAEAEPLMIRAMAIRVKNFGPDNLLVADSLNNLASLRAASGDDAKVREYSLQALAIVEKQRDTNQFRRGVILSNLAHAARGLGEPAEALKFSEQAVTTTESAFGPFHPEVARMLAAQARILVEGDRRDEGMAVALRGEAISRDHLALTARTAPEREALEYASTRVSGINLLMTMAETNRKDHESVSLPAWDSVIRSRALILDEMGARRRVAEAASDPVVAGLEQEMLGASQRLAKLVIGGPGKGSLDEFTASVNAARRAKDGAERAFAARSEGFRRTLALSLTGLSDVAAALPRGAALVAFVRYGHLELARPQGGQLEPPDHSTPSYAAFILATPGVEPVLVPLGEAARIDGLVTRWRETTVREALAAGRASKAGEAAHRKVAEELRRTVWDPVARHLGAAQQLLIVPDGTLNLVTFAALPLGEARYLIEQGHAFHYLSSERDVLAPRSDAKGGGLLALSNPDFDDRKLFAALGLPQARTTSAPEERTAAAFRGSRSACGTFPSMRFGPLPATALETGEIIRVWGEHSIPGSNLRHVAESAASAESLTGAAANETMFKRTASGHRVLHVATHGFFLGGDCQSALGSPAADGTSSASRAVTRENPLLLSGLVLAGANHREAAGPDEDDGILTAEEIATLNLQGTEWAVLSACDTGTGEIRAGEGVFGLRRAFQLAGARTVIMSLWPVEDEATRQWMTALYRHRFGEAKTTAAAVNDASLELLQQRRARGESTHPFYWAGFIAAGDWR